MISIIIPIYNRTHLIEETLHSIVEQTYTNWECIIVDDGSTDDTFSITHKWISNDTRFQLFKRPKDFQKGPSACRNYGISKSIGDFIQFFDSDDLMHPRHLEKKIKAIGKKDLVVCKLLEFRGDFDKRMFDAETKFELKEPKHLFLDFVTGVFPMMMVAPMWKKTSLIKYLPIREDLHILEDHELYARALKTTKKVAVVDESLIYYRIGSASSSQSFYTDVNSGLRSYLEAKSSVLKLTKHRKVKYSVLTMTLWVFRKALAERNFKAADICLKFMRDEKLWYSFKLKLKYTRIYFFYLIFKIIKRGDTKFKNLFKL